MIERIAIEGFRSIQSLVVDLEQLTVITGPNGSGKSNLYRSLQLLAECGAGRVVGALARMGGLDGVLWAGPERPWSGAGPAQGTVRKSPVSLRLGFGSGDLGYAVDLGLPIRYPKLPSAFDGDPQIKQEHVFHGEHPRPASMLAVRKGSQASSRDAAGWVELSRVLHPWDSLLDELHGVAEAPELASVRRTLRSWRFHDAVRTDPAAPARRAEVATRATRLDDDGGNLASVLQTTIEQADGRVERAVAHAFPGSRLDIGVQGGRLELRVRQAGLLRPLGAAELSDGTLQYLLLTAALTSVERPGLLVLNEPERSLHDDLLPALGGLIREAAAETQTVVVTHSRRLADAVRGTEVRLARAAGATIVEGREGLLDQPRWVWPKR